MGFDTLIELLQSYARDYVFAALAILTHPGDEGGEGSAANVLTPSNPRTWVFCLISITLGSLAQAAATSADFNHPSFDPLSFGAVITVWLWVLFAVIAHVLIKLMGGKGTFLDTLGVALRVLPVVYMLSGFVALTVSLLSRRFSPAYAAWAVDAFLITQFVLLAVYLPVGLRHAHKSGRAVQAVLTVALPALVLAINLTISAVEPSSAPGGPTPPAGGGGGGQSGHVAGAPAPEAKGGASATAAGPHIVPMEAFAPLRLRDPLVLNPGAARLLTPKPSSAPATNAAPAPPRPLRFVPLERLRAAPASNAAP